MDIKIAGVLAKDGNISNQEFQDYVNIVKQIMVLEENIAELEERRDLVAEEFNWFVVTQDDHFNEEEYETLLKDTKNEINNAREEIERLREGNKLGCGVGPCQPSIDITLQAVGVERQAYYDGCIIGNHCHKLLEDDVSKKLCFSIPIKVAENTNNQEVYNEAVEQCEKFKILFGKYGKCHRVFNSARHLQFDEIYALDENIKSFLVYLRMNCPEIKISPKLQMVEDHMIPFLMKWRVGCGFRVSKVANQFTKCLTP